MKNNFIRYIYYTEQLYTPIPWDYETIAAFFETGVMPENFTEALANTLIGHKMAFNAMLQLSKAKVPMTEALLNEFHKMLLSDSNKYRADLDDHLMTHFMDQMTASAYLPPVEYALQCHRRLLEMSPWEDRNGQVAMLLMNYILLSKDLPMVIFEDSEAYEAAMNALFTDLNDKPMLTLMEASQI